MADFDVKSLGATDLSAPFYSIYFSRIEPSSVLDTVIHCCRTFSTPAVYRHELSEALFRELLRISGDSSEVRAACFERLVAERGPTAEWLRARLGNTLDAWGTVIDHAVGPRPARYLHRARLRLDGGDFRGAAADLREALRDRCDYADMERALKVFKRLKAKTPFTDLTTRRVRVAILGTFTTRLIAPLLELAAFRDGVDLSLYEADYGVLHQEILDRESGLRAFRPDVVILATSWRDAGLPPVSPEPDIAVRAAVEPLISLWRVLREDLGAQVIQHNFDVPLVDSLGALSTVLPGGRARLLRRANLALLDAAGTGVSVLDFDSVASEVGKENWVDEGLWYRAKQHPSPMAIPVLVDHYMAHLRAIFGLTKKVLVLDLDNTVWGGVIGEDGLEGLRLGVTDPEGEAHTDLQRYAKELRDRGVVLAVCSKNNDSDAKEPFERSAEMVLSLADIAVFRANWQDKATNLREISRALELGLDTFVFVDDNPTERAWVRGELPEVVVPEVGDDISSYLRVLQRCHSFDALTLSDEDKLRAGDYAANARRSELLLAAGTLEEFIVGLQMSAVVSGIDELNLPRVAQLVNKSNQFNLTTRRYTQEQLRALAARSDYEICTIRLRDRFADNGLIGVIIGKVVGEGTGATFEIDTWLMSCRVLGRRVEEFMAGEIMQRALWRGVSRVLGRYIPTAKNGLVRELYSRLGFEKVDEKTPKTPGVEGETVWVYDLKEKAVLTNKFIRVENGAGEREE